MAVAVTTPAPPDEAAPAATRLSSAEWLRVGGMTATIVGLHLIGWGVFIFAVLPQHYQALPIGVAVTAYTLGMRHAFDADHIAAIDNTTRKLMGEGERPLSVGFFFSLGHSSVVVALGVGITVAARAVFGAVTNPHSSLETFGGVFGTSISGVFLYLIAAMNLVVLVGIVRVFIQMRRGQWDEVELEAQLDSRGFMYRFFGRFMRSVHRPWQMYPVGVLFGLGFDTATEIAFLAITAGAATAHLPWYAILCLPILFTAGMTLLDTIDGSFMNFAYGWAFARPVRKVYYNIVITGLSIFVAFFIGTVELVGLLATEVHLRGGLWSWAAAFKINQAGFVIAGGFVLCWVVALSVWKWGRIEARWELSAARHRAARAAAEAD
jgi:nickel/cobalt transporter (NiCoT) family protein